MAAGNRSSRFIKYVTVVALFGIAGLIGGCGQKAASQDPAALEGVEWSLAATSDSALDLADFGITAKFDGAKITGFSGVNTYTGGFEAKEDGSFNAGPLAATLMAGPEDAMEAETAFLALLDAAESFEVSKESLVLKAADGDTLTFEPAEPFSFSGSSWLVTGFNNGKEAVTSPALNSELTLKFTDEKRLSGSGGVNNFTGEYSYDEDSIAIGPLASTKMMGEKEFMTQEQAYFAALEAASTWDVSNGVLNLRDASGATQVTATKK